VLGCREPWRPPNVSATLRREDIPFGSSMNLESPEEPWYSAELGWSDWAALQSLALEIMPLEQISHLLSMEA